MPGSVVAGGMSLGFLLLIMFGVFMAMFSVAAVCLAILRFVFMIPGQLLGFVFGSHRPYVEKRPRMKSQGPTPSCRSRTTIVRGGQKECANRRCGYANRSSAVYCGRCGQRL